MCAKQQVTVMSHGGTCPTEALCVLRRHLSYGGTFCPTEAPVLRRHFLSYWGTCPMEALFVLRRHLSYGGTFCPTEAPVPRRHFPSYGGTYFIFMGDASYNGEIRRKIRDFSSKGSSILSNRWNGLRLVVKWFEIFIWINDLFSFRGVNLVVAGGVATPPMLKQTFPTGQTNALWSLNFGCLKIVLWPGFLNTRANYAQTALNLALKFCEHPFDSIRKATALR